MANKPSALGKVAQAVAAAYATVQESGGLLDTVCGVLNTQYKGGDVPEADVAFICDEVSRIRSWSASSARVRKAEMKTIMGFYSVLPDAMAKLRANRKNEKPVTFEAGLRLARALKANDGNVARAIAAFIAGRTPTKPADRNEEQALESAKTHINRVLEHTALNKKFRAALSALCVEFDIAL